MALAHLFALGAALSWTLAGLFSHQAVLRFGSLHFNRLRMLAAAFLLVVMMALTDGSFVLPMAFWKPVLFSAGGWRCIGGIIFYLWQCGDWGPGAPQCYLLVTRLLPLSSAGYFWTRFCLLCKFWPFLLVLRAFVLRLFMANVGTCYIFGKR